MSEYYSYNIGLENMAKFIFLKYNFTFLSPGRKMLFIQSTLVRIKICLLKVFRSAFCISTMRTYIKVIIAYYKAKNTGKNRYIGTDYSRLAAERTDRNTVDILK